MLQLWSITNSITRLRKDKKTSYVPQQAVVLKLAELHGSGQTDKKIYTNISKILDRMSRDGLVEKVRAGQRNLVALTDVGELR